MSVWLLHVQTVERARIRSEHIIVFVLPDGLGQTARQVGTFFSFKKKKTQLSERYAPFKDQQLLHKESPPKGMSNFSTRTSF